MITIKGVYKDGKVRLLERPPVLNKDKVLITFMKENENDEKLIAINQYSQAFKEYLEDTREDLYQEYVSRNQ